MAETRPMETPGFGGYYQKLNLTSLVSENFLMNVDIDSNCYLVYF